MKNKELAGSGKIAITSDGIIYFLSFEPSQPEWHWLDDMTAEMQGEYSDTEKSAGIYSCDYYFVDLSEWTAWGYEYDADLELANIKPLWTENQ